MARAATESSADGRTRRGERNRERIVEALLALIGGGEPMPTAEQVAERAQVSTRSVFRHFEDMERLYAEMSRRVHAEVRPLLDAPLPDGPLAARVDGLVRRRSRIFERLAPYLRSGALQRWHSEYLQQDHARMTRRLREDLVAALPETAEAPAAVLDALEAITSFEAWERLRGDQRLGRERAEETVQTAVLALLRAP